MSLALSSELIGTIIYAEEGDFKILDLLDYDSMTHQFSLQVQEINTLEVSVRELSDKIRYEVNLAKKPKPNHKRLRPKKK